VGGVKDMVPRIIRDPMKAAGISNNGVTTGAGKSILPASQVTTGDVIAQALGFQPARVSEAREAHFAILEAKTETNQAHSKLVKEWLSADPDDKADVMEDIQDFNRAHPTMPITQGTLLKARNAQIKAQREANSDPQAYGLSLPKKGAAALEAAGSFANAQ
jgi:hypothetical protein